MIHMSGWVILAVILYVIVLIFAFGAKAACRSIAGKSAAFLGVFIGGIAVINLLSFGMAHTVQVRDADSSDAAKVFGLESGKAYPLVLGNRLGGPAMEATARSGFFSASVSISITPASSVSVSFTHESDKYILDLPTSSITFHSSVTTPPSVTIFLDHDGDYGQMAEEKKGPCKFMIESGFAVCHQVVIYTATPATLGPATMRQGLGPIVQHGFVSAQITLTPEQYNGVLGGKG